MKLSGVILRAGTSDFVMRPNMHVDIRGEYQYVPFVSDGVVIKYGSLKKLARISGMSCQDMVAREIGKSMEFEIEKKVTRKKGELGEVYKSLYFTCLGII
jgi:hypothetical protein